MNAEKIENIFKYFDDINAAKEKMLKRMRERALLAFNKWLYLATQEDKYMCGSFYQLFVLYKALGGDKDAENNNTGKRELISFIVDTIKTTTSKRKLLRTVRMIADWRKKDGKCELK
jgi:hypothetical protein